MFKNRAKITILIILLSGILFLLLLNRILQKPQITQIPPILMQEQSSTPTPVINQQLIPSGFSNPSIEYIQQHADYIKQTPVLQKLPAHSDLYGIIYNDEQHLIVYSKVVDKDSAYTAAKKWFSDNNIDISKISIDYK